jgi:hypothetical protein
MLGPIIDSACQNKNQTMRSKKLSVEVRDRIVSRYRFGEGYQPISATLKVLKITVASIVLKLMKFGATNTLPRECRLAKLSNQGRRALISEATKNPMVTLDRAPEFLCGDRRTFQKDNHLCSTSPIRPLW